MIKILGVGHPRTGTGFTSKVFRLWGLDVGHEKLKKDGVVAWQLINETGPYPYILDLETRPLYEHLVYNIRNPRDSLPSIVYTENIKELSFDYRNSFYQNRMTSDHPVENAILSIIEYDNIVKSMSPSIVYRIEDQKEDLFKYFKNLYPTIKYKGISKKVNKRIHPSFDDMLAEFGDISLSYKKMINNYCLNYGYKKLFKKDV